MTRMTTIGLALLLPGWAFACRPASEIVLDVDTDLMIPSELDAVKLEIGSGGVRRAAAPPREIDIDLTGANAPSFPLTLGLVPAGGVTTSALFVLAIGARSGAEVVRQQAQTDFVDGKSLLLRLVLSESCAAARSATGTAGAALPLGCAEGQTCVDGACQDVRRPGAALPGWTGKPPPRPPMRDRPLPVEQRSVWAAGGRSCAVDGSQLYCWGQNTDGQLGIGNTQNAMTRQPVPTITAPLAIGLGQSHSCACDATGKAFCWGRNVEGEVGNGATTAATRPTAVAGVGDCAKIAGGAQHTCVLHKGGLVSCWGGNAKGQLGQPASAAPSPTPSAVPGLTDVVDVGAADRSTCALRSDGSVWCWGDNSSGELGDGTTKDHAAPAPVAGLGMDVVELAVSRTFVCVRRAASAEQGGQVWCWGDNAHGQLAAAAPTFSPFPVQVGDIVDATEIAAGGAQHVCIIRGTGVASCWGGNPFGQFGNGSTVGSTLPVDVVGLSDVVSLTAGSNHTCARRASGLPCLCWGENNVSQLGEGTTTDRPTPVSVYGFAP